MEKHLPLNLTGEVFFNQTPQQGKGDAAEAANVPLFPPCVLPPKGGGS